MTRNKVVLVTGGAGYVGAVLTPKLAAAGHEVRVLDLFLYGEDVFAGIADHPRLRLIKADIRDRAAVEFALRDVDSVIHLACISNDPSFELDPALGRSINYEAFIQLVESAKSARVGRFIYASSSSVYGVKQESEVTEELPLEPLTDYSKYKALCEQILLDEQNARFVGVVLRPATVCGYSPRLRLDLTVNLLTAQAIQTGCITVFGGEQKRPNIHIDDMADLYVRMLDYPDELIAGEIFNAGYENHEVRDIATMVRRVVGDEKVRIEAVPTNDRRSYHISSAKIKRKLGFVPSRSVEDAVRDLVAAFAAGKVPRAIEASRYYNIRTMQELQMR